MCSISYIARIKHLYFCDRTFGMSEVRKIEKWENLEIRKSKNSEIQKFGKSEKWKFAKSEVRKNGNSVNRKVRKKGYPKE